MRISDWSSDVCSSDLRAAGRRPSARSAGSRAPAAFPDTYPPVSAAAESVAHRAADRRVSCRSRRSADGRAIHLGHAIPDHARSEEHTSELQSLMRISYAVFCLKKKKQTKQRTDIHN